MAQSGSLTFLSASEYGVTTVATTHLQAGSLHRDVHNPNAFKNFGKIDFVGLNTYIHDPISGSENHLGQDPSHPMTVFAAPTPPGNTTQNPARIADVDLVDDGEAPAYTSLYTTNSPPGLFRADATIFNALMLNRNGPYGHPMWKQWRGYNHPIARHHRLTNTM